MHFFITKGATTPLLNRGLTKNKFRIVAYGSKFDIYINDEFLIGFEDELFDKGTVGFTAKMGCYLTIDNVKIWEAVSE